MASKNKIKDLKTIYSTLKYNYIKRQKSVASPSDPSKMTAILDKYKKHNTVFVHIGLKQIKTAYGVDDPYGFIFNELTKRFQSIMTPGFTPSFKKTGLYHKELSKPEYGSFAKNFLNDATYRTDDPAYSLLVYGKYDLTGCNTKESFGKGSSFEKIDKDNILNINIGTKWLVSSQAHYIEYKNMVPYIKKETHEGIIYYNSTEHEKTSVTTYKNIHWFNKYLSIIWNRGKMLKDMLKSDIIEYHNINGLKIFIFRSGDLKQFLDEKIKKDPYYLIT